MTVVIMDTAMTYIWDLTVIAVVKLVEAACLDDRDRETAVLRKASGYSQSCCATCEEVLALQNLSVKDLSRGIRTSNHDIVVRSIDTYSKTVNKNTPCVQQ